MSSPIRTMYENIAVLAKKIHYSAPDHLEQFASDTINRLLFLDSQPQNFLPGAINKNNWELESHFNLILFFPLSSNSSFNECLNNRISFSSLAEIKTPFIILFSHKCAFTSTNRFHLFPLPFHYILCILLSNYPCKS